MNDTRFERWLPFFTALLAIAPPSFAGIVVHHDQPAFQAQLVSWQTADFESAAPGDALTEISLDDTVFSVSTSDNRENRAVELQDGYGAIAQDGSRFWKLAGGTTTVDFGGEEFDALGFYYSDLESADVVITLHGDADEQFLLEDHNPNQNNFVGLTSDAPFTSFSLTWVGNQGDGLGVDAMMLGTTTPEPGTMLLAVTGLAMVVRRRG